MFHPPHAVLSYAPLARVALRATVACVAALVLSARTASSQQSGKVVASKATTTPAQAAKSTADSVVCDSVAAPAAAPHKPSVARVRKPRPRRVAAATSVAAKPRPAKRPRAVAHAKRPATGRAAGRRVASSEPAKRTRPPQCRTVAAAPVPQVGAMADLVNSLPWTPPADVAFPQATAPSLGDFGEGLAMRTGTLAAGLLGAGAFWLGSGNHGDTPPAIVVTPPGDTPPGGDLPPVTTVPEPATLALVASGLAAIGARARRRKS